MKLFNNTWKLAIAGAIVGVLAALLAFFGNPANMAICVACFIRDTAGALSLHSAAPVQYFRPEIVGFLIVLDYFSYSSSLPFSSGIKNTVARMSIT